MTSAITCVGRKCKTNNNCNVEKTIHRVYDLNTLPQKNTQLDIIVTFLLEPRYQKNRVRVAINKVLNILPNADIVIVDKTGEQNIDKLKCDFGDIKNVEIVDINAGFIPPVNA